MQTGVVSCTILFKHCCISWVSELCYLGVNIVNSTSLKFSFERAKQHFYRAANSIFGEIGRLASEEVVIELFKCKCLPILLYCTEACKLTKANIHFFDFAVNKFFMKLLKTINIEIIKYCQEHFDFHPPTDLIICRTEKSHNHIAGFNS